MIETGDLDKLSRLTLDMFFPMLTFSTITRTFDPNRLTELWVMPLLGIALMLFGAGAGWVFKRLMKSKGHGREGTFHHICAINNYVFLPIIVLQNIYGERHVALLLLMNVGSTIGFWTIGVLTLTGGGSLSKTMKSIFSINVAAVAAALLVSFLHIPLPEALNYTFQYLGNITVPLMLVVIGVGELTRQGQEIIAVNFRAFEVWLTVAIFYLAMTLSISAVLRYYERKLMIGRRAVPASPSDPQM